MLMLPVMPEIMLVTPPITVPKKPPLDPDEFSLPCSISIEILPPPFCATAEGAATTDVATCTVLYKQSSSLSRHREVVRLVDVDLVEGGAVVPPLGGAVVCPCPGGAVVCPPGGPGGAVVPGLVEEVVGGLVDMLVVGRPGKPVVWPSVGALVAPPGGLVFRDEPAALDRDVTVVNVDGVLVNVPFFLKISALLGPPHHWVSSPEQRYRQSAAGAVCRVVGIVVPQSIQVSRY